MNRHDVEPKGPPYSQDRPADDEPDDMTLYTPSQAEGDRDTIDADIERKLGQGSERAGGSNQYATGGGGQGDVVHTPSQAEGDRQEIEEDLQEKGEE